MFRKIVFILILLVFEFGINPHVAYGQSRIKVLLIVAHPDDETMAMGSLLRLIEKGAVVKAIYATRGEGGRIHGELVSQKQASKVRTQEVTQAAAAIGFTDVKFLDAPDVALRDPLTGVPSGEFEGILREHWNVPAISEKLTAMGAEFKPDIVITHSHAPGAHNGHKAIRRITEDLFREGIFGQSVLYAIDEGNRIQGSHEVATSSLHFSLDELSPSTNKTYAQRAFEIENIHSSQHGPRHRLRSGFEELLLIGGSGNPLLTQLSTGPGGPCRKTLGPSESK